MGDGQGTDWLRALDEVDRAVQGCLAALDRYEAKFGAVLADAGHPPARAADRPPPPADGWNLRLAAAQEQVDAVEHLLTEQELVWGRWREAFANWRRSIEQQPLAKKSAG